MGTSEHFISSGPMYFWSSLRRVHSYLTGIAKEYDEDIDSYLETVEARSLTPQERKGLLRLAELLGNCDFVLTDLPSTLSANQVRLLLDILPEELTVFERDILEKLGELYNIVDREEFAISYEKWEMDMANKLFAITVKQLLAARHALEQMNLQHHKLAYLNLKWSCIRQRFFNIVKKFGTILTKKIESQWLFLLRKSVIVGFAADAIGYATFDSEDHLGRFVRLLEDNYLMRDNHLLDAQGLPVSKEPNVINNPDDNIFAVIIPRGKYHNWASMGEGLYNYCNRYQLIWASADGCFQGEVLTPSQEITVDLFDWAKERKFPAPPTDTLDNYNKWELTVVEDFIQQHRGLVDLVINTLLHQSITGI